MNPASGPSEEPRTQLAEILNSGLDRIKEAAAEKGIELERVVLAARRAGVEDGHDAETVFDGFDEPGEMIAFFIAHAQAVASVYGIQLQIHKVNRG